MSAAAIRELCEAQSGAIHNRHWAELKRVALVGNQQKISYLRALILWLAVAQYSGYGKKYSAIKQIDLRELIKAAHHYCHTCPGRVQDFINSQPCQGFGAAELKDSIEGLVPELPDIRWRSTVEGWCRKAGIRFSACRSFSSSDVVAISKAAYEGIGKGRPRELEHGGNFAV